MQTSRPLIAIAIASSILAVSAIAATARSRETPVAVAAAPMVVTTALDAPPEVSEPDVVAEPARACTGQCGRANDCPSIACRCEDGSIINTRNCTDGCCLAAEEACTDSCHGHDGRKGTWDPAQGKQTGKACRSHDDCASKLCERGFCSRTCESFGDCPPFWECTDEVCVKD